jgi:hypothetical protein
MGETAWPKARRKTHREAASSNQLAAAQIRAWVRSWRSRSRISSRSAIFCTSADTDSAGTSGSRRAILSTHWAAWLLPLVRRSTVPAKRTNMMTPAMAAKPYRGL